MIIKHHGQPGWLSMPFYGIPAKLVYHGDATAGAITVACNNSGCSVLNHLHFMVASFGFFGSQVDDVYSRVGISKVL